MQGGTEEETRNKKFKDIWIVEFEWEKEQEQQEKGFDKNEGNMLDE